LTSCRFSQSLATVCLLLLLLASLRVGIPVVTAAQGVGGFSAVLTEWSIPTAGSMPTDLALDPSGNCCWFVESSGNKIAQLDPAINTFREWVIPTASSKPLSLGLTTISGSLAVFGTESAKDRVFLFFPDTGTFKEYALPSEASGPRYISIEQGGTEIRAWFSRVGDSAGVIVYDSSRGTARLFLVELPSAAGGRANGVSAGSGVVWLAGATALVKWDRLASEFTSWATPSHPLTEVVSLDVDVQGQVWYTMGGPRAAGVDSYVGVLRTNDTFVEWQIPTSGADPQGLSISPVTRNPWIAEHGGDRVARLDPTIDGTAMSSRPIVTRSAPTSGALMTIATGPVLPSTVRVTPVASASIESTTGEFTEWILPTGSQPRDVVVDASGNVWILESSSNKVARLSLKPDFNLGCEPSSLLLVQDASETSICTVTSIYGFNSEVQLSGSWIGSRPSGVVYTLPTPITPDPSGTASSTLMIVAGARASTGTFAFQVTATSGSLIHKANVTVTIAEGVVDFTITITPSSLSVVPSGSAVATVTIQSLGVFFSPVHLASLGAPGGMSVYFDRNPVTPPIRGIASSNLAVSVSGAPQGTHLITVMATGDSIAHTATLTVRVTGGCLIATATYGSELSDEVQFLRNFRDNSILTTRSGSSFMTAFNAWYYSFSPTIAQVIREHSTLRTTVKFVLYPLIGILRIGATLFDFLPSNPEVNALASGLVVSSLIGAIYVAIPHSILFVCSSKARRVSGRILAIAVVLVLGGLAAAACGIVCDGPVIVLMAATSTIVLSSLAGSALATSGIILRLISRLSNR